MKILEALKAGTSKTKDYKKYIAINYLTNFIIAAVLAAGLASVLEDSLGDSMAGSRMNSSFDELWFRSFTIDASGIAGTFRPDVVGKGAVARSLDSFLQGNLLNEFSAIAGAGLIYLLFSTFFSAGYISVYSNDGEEEISFFGSASKNFLRIFGVTLIAAIIYVLLFYYIFEYSNIE